MNKVYSSLSFFYLVASFVLLPLVKESSSDILSPSSKVEEVTNPSGVESVASMLYDKLNLTTLGMSRQAMVYAYKGLQSLKEKGIVSNPDILTICDFSQPSTEKRMFIIDMKQLKVLITTYVAHGKNSGLKYAERFSNGIQSLQSSLGFYLTKGIYFGKHGLSLKLAGVEKGFNDNAEERAIVVHGADYIGNQRSGTSYMGRSFGCPAVPSQIADKLINTIKGGTTFFIYHPTPQYLHSSCLLNS